MPTGLMGERIAIALAGLTGLMIGAAWVLLQTSEPKSVRPDATCVPIYYSGFECCKN
jgi:hypothetical protein